MASLREKVEAELEQMDQALRELPGARRVGQLSEQVSVLPNDTSGAC